jgi:hypothetical protein
MGRAIGTARRRDEPVKLEFPGAFFFGLRGSTFWSTAFSIAIIFSSNPRLKADVLLGGLYLR